jgi:hypothetical protein
MDEFVNVLALVEDIIHGNSDCHLVLGGDFNVDFRRDRSHTALLNDFWEDVGLISSILHSAYNVDYTYKFNMSRFSILDHFILSSALYNECIADVSVLHDIDNLSDHEPLLLQLDIDVTSSTLHSRAFIPHVSWVKASESNIYDYHLALSTNLRLIKLPVDTLLCSDMHCKTPIISMLLISMLQRSLMRASQPPRRIFPSPAIA